MNTLRAGDAFPDTRWSAVLRVRADGVGGGAVERALADLCAAYWYPLYAYARRCGRSPEDAEDLTQGFFGRLIERELFTKADPARGRLRSFLLGSFKRFMSEERQQANRQKRGGGQVFVPIDQVQAEQLYRGAGADELSPDVLFERAWFNALLEGALDELEREQRQRGKEQLFHRLQGFLAWDRGEQRINDLAREIGMSAGALRVTIFRLRQRFREILERQITDTVETPAEAAQELRQLLRAVGG
jgi:RNA polymerase sigma-70 factor (ECF subfamily)